MIKIVGPFLHHLVALWEMSCAVIGTSQGIFHSVCKLRLDDWCRNSQHLVQNRTCHSAEAVASHGFAVVPQPAERGVYSVIRHGALFCADAREQQPTAPCEGPKFAQDVNCLARERDNVRAPACLSLLGPLHALTWDFPRAVVEIELGPFGRSQLAGPLEKQWREAERARNG